MMFTMMNDTCLILWFRPVALPGQNQHYPTKCQVSHKRCGAIASTMDRMLRCQNTLETLGTTQNKTIYLDDLVLRRSFQSNFTVHSAVLVVVSTLIIIICYL